jgi:hypothetical protein
MENIKQKREVIWKNQIDKIYDIIVYRTEPYKGNIVITDSRNQNVLLDDQTSVSFDARFGPDYADVQEWMKKGLEVVDSL